MGIFKDQKPFLDSLENQMGLRPTYMGINAPAYNPAYKSEYDSLPYLQGQLGPAQASIAALRGEAMRPAGTASPWAGIAAQSQLSQAAGAKDRLARDLAGGQATAQSQLAMRGGLTGGARERIAQEGSRGFARLSQDVNRQTRENLFNISLQDEQNRRQDLRALPGQELMLPKLLTSTRGMDVGQRIDETGRFNDYNQNIYNQQMRAQAAANIAAAQRQEAARSNGLFGLGFLGL